MLRVPGQNAGLFIGLVLIAAGKVTGSRPSKGTEPESRALYELMRLRAEVSMAVSRAGFHNSATAVTDVSQGMRTGPDVKRLTAVGA